METILGVFKSIVNIIAVSWWVILPVGLFFIWRELWVRGLNRLWRRTIKYKMIEIKIPKEILKTPKAMENVFAALHAIQFKGFTLEDTYFKGEEQQWMTFELVGHNGTVHFIARFPDFFRNLIESAIYSEYPNAELADIEDYTEYFPNVLPNNLYDIWGNDYVLKAEDAYPIRTYDFFEANVDEQRLDPIAAITEVMSRLKATEAIWIQYLIKPVPDNFNNWKKKGEIIRDKMMQRKKETPKGFLGAMIDGLFEFTKNLIAAPVALPQWAGMEKKEEKLKFLFLSPGEQDILKGVEKKISKVGFEVGIRFIYIDERKAYTGSNVRAVDGAIRQFNTQDMNGFKTLRDTITFITARKLTSQSWFRSYKLHFRKRQIFDMYKLRWFPSTTYILNTEELATVFHFPIETVGAPLLRRLQTRKGEPPSGLPLGEE